MSYIRTIKRVLKDGTERIYYCRVEGYREGGRVKQRVIEYLGVNPNRFVVNIDPTTAARVASIILKYPSMTDARKMLRNAGIPFRGKPNTVSLTYNPPLRRCTIKIE
jgi:hypothetical protein